MKKEILTCGQIKQDIVLHLGRAKGQTKREYFVWLLATVAFAVAAAVLRVFFSIEVFWVLVLTAAVTLVLFGFYILRMRRRKRHVDLNDYAITTDALYDKEEERYNALTGKHLYREITNRILYFANGSAFFLPMQIGASTGERIFEQARRGDKFIVVTHKKTGEIAVVYPTSLFVYQEHV